ncbi:hypothetical protein M378DRAFT_67723 [Amanita muscaria Koide BX008]|uniref:Cytochrome c oxidase assembly factor 3 n=1 Tax=Amanita muscaria (strain Koide BX008) TaxID=946122 RepID=A0A0C2XMK3_AMAMK|nr:hypothetical protein M378DRAFT_67723 [Amanita muscaria Koide BX008]
MSGSQYADRRAAQASYRPKAGTMSPGLKRAREPYRFRNALTGFVLGAFAVSVWAYSISAVKQDVFDDIDDEARALQNQSRGGANATATADVRPNNASRDRVSVGSATSPISATSDPTSSSRTRADEAILAGAVTAQVISNVPPPSIPASGPKRGVLQYLDFRFPNLLDPVNKTLVWGAPPVDNMGTISRSGSFNSKSR